MFSKSLAAIIALISVQQALAQSCSNYTSTNPYAGGIYTSTSSRTYIISRGVDCSSTQGCVVPWGGYLTEGRTVNVSDQSSWDSIFKTISSVVDIDFAESKTYQIAANGSSSTVPNGTAGYVGFTPFLLCTTGRLSGCRSSNLEGVTVMACTPKLLSSGMPDGTIGQVTTDAQSAAALTCNPSNTTQAKNGNYTGGCSSTEDQTGAASSMSGAPLLILSSALLVTFMGL
ncbi:hypothetical protein E4T47_09285 [Aureobasidium subglaciale]|nr:hypothetical protein E4T47_09285 [Aureobasidium subglaciale]